ncbi:MAG: YggS family pyridoxal phosphate-dependent enzyme [Anaerolineae bacterium]|nr:YggS family pyridoxal phosphate-dependent enzyme [Anaerolineae bacterium]
MKDNLARVQERIAAAARRAGRAPAGVTLVAVTKTHPPEVVEAAYLAGLRHFGENRVEEAAPKIEAVAAWLVGQKLEADPPAWHMIGHMQSRKAEDAVGPYALIHSVDSLKLARRLDRFASETGRRLPILLEINVSGEASKYGFTPAEVAAALAEIVALPSLHVQGLMTMAPIVADPEETRPVFRALRALRDDLARRFPQMDGRHLSMGMTDDFEVAIEEGATIVRVGRAIFGERRI